MTAPTRGRLPRHEPHLRAKTKARALWSCTPPIRSGILSQVCSSGGARRPVETPARWTVNLTPARQLQIWWLCQWNRRRRARAAAVGAAAGALEPGRWAGTAKARKLGEERLVGRARAAHLDPVRAGRGTEPDPRVARQRPLQPSDDGPGEAPRPSCRRRRRAGPPLPLLPAAPGRCRTWTLPGRLPQGPGQRLGAPLVPPHSGSTSLWGAVVPLVELDGSPIGVSHDHPAAPLANLVPQDHLRGEGAGGRPGRLRARAPRNRGRSSPPRGRAGLRPSAAAGKTTTCTPSRSPAAWTQPSPWSSSYRGYAQRLVEGGAASELAAEEDRVEATRM